MKLADEIGLLERILKKPGNPGVHLDSLATVENCSLSSRWQVSAESSNERQRGVVLASACINLQKNAWATLIVSRGAAFQLILAEIIP